MTESEKHPSCAELFESLSRLGETVEPDAAEKAMLRECLELVRKKLAGAGG